MLAALHRRRNAGRDSASRGAVRAAACAAAVAALGACAPPIVEYTLVFPSVDTFLVSETAKVELYAAGDGADPDAICRNLSVGQAAGEGLDALDSTGAQAVCEFYGDAGPDMEGVSVGRLVLFAETQAQGVVLMRGCRVADVFYEETPAPIEIQLATLPTYPAEPTIDCTSPDEKCSDVSRVCATF